jgi:anti-sigma factor RsiW
VLSCSEVLARHSEYIDGELPAAEAEVVRAHLSACPSCSRYDRVLRKGVHLLVERPRSEADADFLRSLHSRLAYEGERSAMRPITFAASASVSVAVLLAIAAWLPALLGSHSGDSAGSTLSASIASSEIAWHTATAVVGPSAHTAPGEPDVSLTATNNADISLIDRGYSPLILENPIAPPSYMHATFTALESR